jgi:ABC-type uncharacterized transport system ATPase subunit
MSDVQTTELSSGDAVAAARRVPAPRLELVGITKRYPGVTANDGIDLAVAPGEIHGVLGENGAGKSTLMKIIHGAVRPDDGQLLWDGASARTGSPAAARQRGTAMVFQHFALFDSLTVLENVWLGVDARWSRTEVAERAARVAREHGLELPLDRAVHDLSMGERQRVEIVRALLMEPRLLILDEPTSVLAPAAIERLFETLREIAAGGCSILYVSHKLDEVRALCQRCTVLRAGRVTGMVDPRAETNQRLAELMLGSAPPATAARTAKPKEIAFEVRGLSVPARNGTALAEVALAVRALRTIPEERVGRGAVPGLSLAANVLLTRDELVTRRGWLRPRRARALAARLIERFDVKAAGPDAPAGSLSGGNLQKLIVGREIEGRPRVLLVAQPTWGLDVGAAARIRRELLALADAGCAVLVISEDLEELFEISTTLMVMAKGRLSPPVPVGEATIAQIGAWMGGVGL